MRGVATAGSILNEQEDERWVKSLPAEMDENKIREATT